LPPATITDRPTISQLQQAAARVCPNREMTAIGWARGSVWRSRGRCCRSSGGRHQGEIEPRHFESADVVAGLEVCTDTAGVVAGAVRKLALAAVRLDPVGLVTVVAGQEIVAIPGEVCRGDGFVAVAAGDELVNSDPA